MSMGSLGDSQDVDSEYGSRGISSFETSGSHSDADVRTYLREPADYPAWRALKAATGKNKAAFSIRGILVTLRDPVTHDAGVKTMLDAICAAMQEIGDLVETPTYASLSGTVNFSDRMDTPDDVPGFTVNMTAPVTTNLVMWQTVNTTTLATIWHVRHNTMMKTRPRVIEQPPSDGEVTVEFCNPHVDDIGKESRSIEID